MSEEMVLVNKSSLDMLDKYIHRWFHWRCYVRNMGGSEMVDFSEVYFSDVIERESKEMKELSREFGLYPYNQKEVKYPLIRD